MVLLRCPICRDDFKEGDQLRKITVCSHVFHEDCLENWFKYNEACPVCSKPLNREILRIIRPKRDLSEMRRKSVEDFELKSPTEIHAHSKIGMTSILKRRGGMEGFEDKLNPIWKKGTRHMSMSRLDVIETPSPCLDPEHLGYGSKKKGTDGSKSNHNGQSDHFRDLGAVMTEGPQTDNSSPYNRIETDPGSVSTPLSDRLPMTSSMLSNTSQMPLAQTSSPLEYPNSSQNHIVRVGPAEKPIIKKHKK